MAAKRESNRLDPLKIASLIKTRRAGRHADGGGLYLVVEANGSARWAFIFRWRARLATPGPGRLREMGLGSAGAVSLRRAREKAVEARAFLADRVDPIEARKAHAEVPSFGEVADDVLAVKSTETTSKATVARLRRGLEVFAKPLRSMRVDAVDTQAVLEVLKPIWLEKPETAQKTRGVIEAVLNAAKARGYRAGDNPALWRGHLELLLPRTSKRDRSHHPAMPYAEVPAFVSSLRERDGASARALEFLILTAARVSEVTGAQWGEFDLEDRIWSCPAARMKSRRPHRVPLSGRAAEIVSGLDGDRTGYVFSGSTAAGGLSGAAFDRLLKRMKVAGITVHGFRSSFRDWAGEVSQHPTHLAEAALAHTVGDATERAYARGDALEKRRSLMEDWRRYLG